MTDRKTFLQQSALALAGSCLPFSKLFAKEFKPEQYKPPPNTYHPKDCTIELANQYKYSLSQIQIEDGVYSKNNVANTINCDVMYAAEELGIADADFAAASTCPAFTDQCANVDVFNENPFRYKVYYPKTTVHDYVSTPLPVYVFFHAGSFMECTNYESGQIATLCTELSRKGFICFTVEYRRGRILDPSSNTQITKTTVQQQFARYRAIQDGCGFIRSMIKKNKPNDANKFLFAINESQIFIGGTSAGGIIALGCAYYQTSSNLVSSQTMIDASFPKANGSTYEIKDVLGNMHTNLYYADPLPQYWPKIAGVASLWGGIVIPKNKDGAEDEADGGVTEASFFQSGDPNANPPLIAFHGALDTTVPFKDEIVYQDINSSSTSPYKGENSCTYMGRTFTQKPGPGLKSCSSLNMYYILKRLNRFVEFYTDCSMTHGLDNCVSCGGVNFQTKEDGNCVPCEYTSDFSSGATNPTDTLRYIAARIAVFSHAVMNNPTSLQFEQYGRSYFKDCQNNRKCTQTGSNNTCGTGPDTFCDGITTIPQ